MSTPNERLEAVKKMSVEELLALAVPSSEFVAQLEAINKRTTACADKATTLRRQIELTTKNSEVIELIEQRDPQVALQELRAELADADAGVQRGPSDLHHLFSIERQIVQLKLSAAWTTIYAQFGISLDQKISEQVSAFKSSVQAACLSLLDALNALTASTSNFSPLIAGMDEDVAAFNGYLAQTRLSEFQFATCNPLRDNLIETTRKAFANPAVFDIGEILGTID